MKHLILPVLILTLCGCQNPTQESASTDSTQVASGENLSYDELFNLPNYLTDESISGDVQSLDSSCAILIYPTEDQIAELKKTEGDENFETIADDSNFYQGYATSLLDSLGIKTVTAQNNYVRLRGKQTWTLAIHKKGLPEWNLILFNSSKEPEIIPAINLTVAKAVEYFDLKK